MTRMKLKAHPTWHETGCLDRQSKRPILAAEEPQCLLLRLKGTRQILRLPWNTAWTRAAWIAGGVALQERCRRRRIRRGIFVLKGE
jgi:hypothetical protein